MLNYLKIKILLENKNISRMDFYSKIDMTSKGFDLMMENKRMKVETLEKIAAYFEMPISYFFDESKNEAPANYEMNEKPGNYTNYKEKYYELLEKYNACLEQQANKQTAFTHTPSVYPESTKPKLKS